MARDGNPAAQQQQQQQQQQHDLESNGFSTLPEVVQGYGSDSHSLPEVRHPFDDKILIDSQAHGAHAPHAPNNYKPEELLQQQNPTEPAPPIIIAPDSDFLQTAREEGLDSPEPVTRQKWWQRRKYRILVGGAIAVLLVVLAIVLGVVLSRGRESNSSGDGASPASGNPSSPSGTTPEAFGSPTSFPNPLNNDNNNNNNGAPSSQLSTCQGTICPPVLGSASYATPPTTFLFARGTDNAIWYRSVSKGAWTGPWASLGGSFTSQPVAVSMRDGRVDVFAIGATDMSARFKTFQNGVWDKEWTNLGGRIPGVPSVCSSEQDRLDIITLGAGGDNGVYWKWVTQGDNWQPALVNRWERLGNYSSSTVGMSCVNEGDVHRVDLLAYGKPDSRNSGFGMTTKHRTGSNSKDWTGWSVANGSFKGDPTVVSTVARADYFGIAEDGSMRHRAWLSATDEAVDETNLGGKFQSAPAAFVTGSSRIDVFGVGTDAQLYHKAKLGDVWANEWERLGGYFNSAPTVVVLDAKAGEAVVFGLGPDSNVIHTTLTVGTGYFFGGGAGQRQWFSDGGSVSSKWLRAGPA